MGRSIKSSYSLIDLLSEKTYLIIMLKRFMKICLTIAIFSSPSFSFQANSSTLVTDNPKEIIDQAWQIIYRDFLNYS